MRQYFYIVAHTIVENRQVVDKIIDKVFLQEFEAIKWGRTFATKHPNHTVELYKQEIARTATVEYVKDLSEYFRTETKCTGINFN